MTRELLVGVDHAPPVPMCFGLPGTEEFRGFEVDLLRELALRLGRRMKFTSALWSVILADLEAGRLDLICAAATITAERQRTVDFTDPYLHSSLAVVTRAEHRNEAPSELARHRIGVRIATVAEDYVRNHWSPSAIETFDLNVSLYDALRDGCVDAVVDDLPIASHFARTTAGLALGPELPGSGFQYGIVVAKGNAPLKWALNGALESILHDGTLTRLRNRWLA